VQLTDFMSCRPHTTKCPCWIKFSYEDRASSED